MTRQQALRILNPVLGVLAAGQIAVPLIGKFVEMPTFTYQAHTVNGILIGVLIVTHIILNWSWIKANYLKKKSA